MGDHIARRWTSITPAISPSSLRGDSWIGTLCYLTGAAWRLSNERILCSMAVSRHRLCLEVSGEFSLLYLNQFDSRPQDWPRQRGCRWYPRCRNATRQMDHRLRSTRRPQAPPGRRPYVSTGSRFDSCTYRAFGDGWRGCHLGGAWAVRWVDWQLLSDEMCGHGLAGDLF